MAGLSTAIHPPEPLADHHHLNGFDCVRASLNAWLMRRARAGEAGGASRTYVTSDDSRRVVAYYSLAAGAVVRAEAPKSMARNMPDPIPVIILARLAVDRRVQGIGLGTALLDDAATRAKAGAAIVGARALLVHALDEQAAAFYETRGFVPSPLAPRMLMVAMRHL